MNHLAHCWLARGNNGHIAGGFLGDYYKGPIQQDLPEELQQGIRLHRYIDSLTNQMPEFRSTYERFGIELRRVAPILLDLVADHLLARHWDNHGKGKLSDFTANCYRIIGEYRVPEVGKRVFHHVVSRDLWCEYANFDVILSVMCRILTRLRLEDRAIHLAELEFKLSDFYDDFCQYFPLLEEQVQTWKAANTQARDSKAQSINESVSV
ncbi:MAG: DUF479 domain-containing protein [Gammaproteobacteria bacterium]|nr:DUF479 domain-containing protein [Gammaproteobacteria bacterium]MYF37740.1 DUF479 domain-containing protein [Gammaproteobacteria bacterium]